MQQKEYSETNKELLEIKSMTEINESVDYLEYKVEEILEKG